MGEAGEEEGRSEGKRNGAGLVSPSGQRRGNLHLHLHLHLHHDSNPQNLEGPSVQIKIGARCGAQRVRRGRLQGVMVKG